MQRLKTLLRKVQRSGHLKRHFSVLEKSDRACPLCNSRDSDELANRDRNQLGLITVVCSGCGFIYTNPYLSEKGLNEFYSMDYRKMTKGHAEASTLLEHRPWMKTRANYFADKIQAKLSTSYLDVGCGEGSLPVEIRARFPEVSITVVEPNDRYRLFAADLAKADACETVDKVEKQADLASCIHVLEHTLDPIDFLKSIAKGLKAGATLFVDVPDTEQYQSLSDLHISHCNHFSESTLRYAFAQAGFKVMSIQKHEPPHLPSSLWVEAQKTDEALAIERPSRNAASEQGVRRANQSYLRFLLGRLTH